MGKQLEATQLRRAMVQNQLLPQKIIHSELLEAMLSIPRHEYAPGVNLSQAYSDDDLLQEDGSRALLAPLTVAKLIQAAEVNSNDRVLVIGFGSGYILAVLSQICDQLYGLEDSLERLHKAEELLKEHGCGKPVLSCGRLNDGFTEYAPFDVIIIEGAVRFIPNNLIDQLTANNFRPGRLVTLRYRISQTYGKGLADGIVIKRSAKGMGETRSFEAAAPIIKAFDFEQDRFVIG